MLSVLLGLPAETRSLYCKTKAPPAKRSTNTSINRNGQKEMANATEVSQHDSFLKLRRELCNCHLEILRKTQRNQPTRRRPDPRDRCGLLSGGMAGAARYPSDQAWTRPDYLTSAIHVVDPARVPVSPLCLEGPRLGNCHVVNVLFADLVILATSTGTRRPTSVHADCSRLPGRRSFRKK